jgi:trans-aconitate methyltransferase
VNRQRLSSIAHSHHPIAAPIFGVNVNRLLRRADRRPAARILDLGCGEAAWAMQALAHYPDGHADGVDVSDAAEWDNYEWSWIGSLTEWAVDNPGHPDAAEALTVAHEHRDQWLRGYRNVLGFATLVLRRT